MDPVIGINIILGIFWGTAFIYLLYERQKIQFMRLMLDEDLQLLTYRIGKLRKVWANVRETFIVYDRYEVNVEDKQQLTRLYSAIIEVMEGDDNE